MLERFMKLSICKDVKLSRDYTNYSIRATVITKLDEAGFEARHIITLSSHKSESTIKQYSTKCPENKKREMFDSLSNAIQPAKKKREVAEIVSNPTETQGLDIIDVKQNLPNFNIEPIDEFDTIDDWVLANLLYDIPNDTDQNSTTSTSTTDK